MRNSPSSSSAITEQDCWIREYHGRNNNNNSPTCMKKPASRALLMFRVLLRHPKVAVEMGSSVLLRMWMSSSRRRSALRRAERLRWLASHHSSTLQSGRGENKVFHVSNAQYKRVSL